MSAYSFTHVIWEKKISNETQLAKITVKEPDFFVLTTPSQAGMTWEKGKYFMCTTLTCQFFL
jgi:hypothetical protein